jgi:hypothetical protein
MSRTPGHLRRYDVSQEILYGGTFVTIAARSGGEGSQYNRMTRAHLKSVATSVLWRAARVGMLVLVFSACHTRSAPQYEPAARRAISHHRKVFLTPDTLEPGTYEFVKDLEGGKSFYGTVPQALNAFASDVAEPEGVDVVTNLERWFAPTWLAWAAPRVGGKGVIVKDPCNFDPSRYRGNFYPEGDDSQYDPPLSAGCPPSSPAVQGLARVQARDNRKIFARPGAMPALPFPAIPWPFGPSVSAPSHPQASAEERLVELKRLFDENLITPEEYEKKRTQILGEL